VSDEVTRLDGLEAGRPPRHHRPRSVQRANWPWIVGSEGLGLVLIAVAFYVEDKHRWTGASAATDPLHERPLRCNGYGGSPRAGSVPAAK